MRAHRFYVSQPLGEEVVITDSSKIHQWSKVFRYKKDDIVILFNGDGYDVTYTITSLTKTRVEIRLLSRTPSYVPRKTVTLYLAIIKKDNVELVVQKATELGVTKIVPILSERSEKKNINEERLEAIAIEASEQCGRGDIPTIAPIQTLDENLLQNSEENVAIVLQMGGIPWKELVHTEILRHGQSSVALFIGPEGGWSAEEERLFKENNVTAVSLGGTVLRAETAAIVGVAYALGEV